ncbi:MAG TPA: hypothetical protein VFE51_08215 [Verrucomicrobiae bacterium]|nr:hypothetical protein [Verrucomicrobiae bacterium]
MSNIIGICLAQTSKRTARTPMGSAPKYLRLVLSCYSFVEDGAGRYHCRVRQFGSDTTFSTRRVGSMSRIMVWSARSVAHSGQHDVYHSLTQAIGLEASGLGYARSARWAELRAEAGIKPTLAPIG